MSAARSLCLCRASHLLAQVPKVRKHAIVRTTTSSSTPLPTKVVKSSRFSSSAKEIDNLGTWDSRIGFDVELESSLRHGTIIPKISASNVAVTTNVGRRSYQEDRYTVTDLADNLLLLAVFDGHGGADCSQFCSDHVRSFVLREIEEAAKNADDDVDKAKKVDLQQVLRKTVLGLEASFHHHWTTHHPDERSPGSTATIAVIRDGYELVVAYVGDSRAILCRDGSVRELTHDHCPSNEREKNRIEAAGGEVTFDNIGRCMVNKRLSMSRAIGDFELKSYGVTAEPEITRLSIKHGKDKFLLLSTDGVSFVMSNEEIVDCISNAEKPKEAVDRLLDQTLLYASEDNITAVLLPLGSWGKDGPRSSMLYTSLGRNMALTSRFN